MKTYNVSYHSFRTAHTITSSAHCINERLNFSRSYRLIYRKMASLDALDVQFVVVKVLFYVF